MKISPETLTILKNFSAINTGILFTPGQFIRTRTDSVFAEASVAEDFPLEKGITNLANLLNVIGLFDDPVITFEDKGLRISESNGSAETMYGYAGSATVVLPFPKKMRPIPDEIVEFKISEEQLVKLQKAASILEKPEYKIISDGKTVRMSTADHTKDKGNVFSLVLNSEAKGLKCKMIYKKDHLNLMRGGYTGIVTPTYTIFTHESIPLKYFVGVEPTTSKFGSN